MFRATGPPSGSGSTGAALRRYSGGSGGSGARDALVALALRVVRANVQVNAMWGARGGGVVSGFMPF